MGYEEIEKMEIEEDVERSILLRYRCLLSRRPERNLIINDDDVLNLKIALESSKSLENFLELV